MVQIDYMLQPQVLKHFQSGVSMLEMLIAMTVLAILAAVALPNMSEFGIKQKLVGAAEQVYGHLQQAGQVDLTSTSGLQLHVEVSALGRIAICSPGGSVANYGAC